MKNYIIFIFLCWSSYSFAQSDQGFNYQAVVQNEQGEIIKDDFVSMRFWIVKGSANGDILYRETHNAIYTGSEGILNLQIGTGSSDVGDFSSIDWSADRHFIRIDLDENNGNDFNQMGITQLMAVPYAMHAFSADGGSSGDDWGSQTVTTDNSINGNGTPSSPLTVNTSAVNTDNQELSISGNQLSISNGNTISIPTGGTDADADPTNEIQTLSINGNQLQISDGNEIVLPGDADANPSNEIQDLSVNTTGSDVNLNISNGNTVSFSISDNDDDSLNELQTLSINGTELSISNGNTISIPTGGTDGDADPTNEFQDLSITENGSTVNVLISDGNGASFNNDDDDADPTNEFQDLSITETGSTVNVSISDGNNVSFNNDDDDADPTNEFQDLSNLKSGDDVTINITDGNSTTLNVRDGDFSASNELQNLSFSNNTLSITNGNAVSIAEGKWTENSSANAVYYDGKVNVGIDNFSNNTTGAELYVNGQGMFQNEFFPNSYSKIGDQGSIDLYNQGTNVVSLGGSGILTLRDPLNGTGNQIILNSNDGTGIFLRNNNQPLIDLTKTSAGGGRIDITNQFGNNATVQLGTDAVSGMGYVNTYFASSINTNLYVSSASNEYGGIAVYDAFETAQAGLAIDTNGDGIVFADVKNFRMDHPENEEEEIWYASLEGPEAGAYERGTAQLVNGEALVPFSDHYTLVIAEDGMTVMLSPLSAESLGLAVIEKTKEGFKVKELYGGTGNYSFDWEVKGVRKGFEDYKVIREKKDMVVRPKR
ncbi:MAG: hypothetical protein P8Q41_03150 [Saprospiraceae bacterium]|jgi:hypothetical protein|nr:hypothetical protein [Saprospiraceae bacterium]